MDKDFKITYTRGSGPGGQHKNKVETCVVIEHLPTGFTERCQDTRSQAQNQKIAMQRLETCIDAKDAAIREERMNQWREASKNQGVIRTYNYARNEVKDHRTGKKANLKKVLNGNLKLIR